MLSSSRQDTLLGHTPPPARTSTSRGFSLPKEPPIRKHRRLLKAHLAWLLTTDSRTLLVSYMGGPLVERTLLKTRPGKTTTAGIDGTLYYWWFDHADRVTQLNPLEYLVIDAETCEEYLRIVFPAAQTKELPLA